MNEIYLSAKDVASYIDSTVRTIENWAAASKIKQNTQGKYGLISAFKHRNRMIGLELEKTKVRLTEAESSRDEEYKSVKNRKAIAEADKEEALAEIKQLELAQLEGKLIDAESVETEWVDLISTCAAKFSGLPAKLALQLSGMNVPQEIQQLLTDVIYECLSELGDLSKAREN